MESAAVRSLDDGIKFNKANPRLKLLPDNPGPESLIAAAESSVKEEELEFLRDLFYEKAGRDGVEKAIRIQS